MSRASEAKPSGAARSRCAAAAGRSRRRRTPAARSADPVAAHGPDSVTAPSMGSALRRPPGERVRRRASAPSVQRRLHFSKAQAERPVPAMPGSGPNGSAGRFRSVRRAPAAGRRTAGGGRPQLTRPRRW
jgi:hypothetical protein